MTNKYMVCVYVPHGYYEYEVSRPEQAIEHGQEILARGVYRRSVEGGVEMYPVKKVKIKGPGLDSAYADTFRRT
jgi:hypothetical protein